MRPTAAALVLTSLTLLLAANGSAAFGADSAPASPGAGASRYEYRAEHSRDGIGKFYLNREIAHVIGGHGAAEWLERPERETEERTSKLMELLKLRDGMAIADIGCGTGYVSRRLARKAGAASRIYAVDIQPDLLSALTNRVAQEGLTNVFAVLGGVKDPNLPANSIDLAVLVDVYHEFEHPYEMTEAMVRALKPGGRLAFVEYRGEDPAVPIKLLHKMTEAQVKKEMAPHPLEWVETIGGLPWQHVIVFQKKASPK